MYVITKDFHLSYSHQLHGLPAGHPCGRVHGHNGVVTVELSTSGLDASGFVLDYGRLSPLGVWLDATFDHRHVNDVVDFQPTAELLARHVFQWCAHQSWPVTAVGWAETPKTVAWWRP